MARLPLIEELNELNKDQLVSTLTPILEATPIIVDIIYPLRPFSSYDELVNKLDAAVAKLSTEEHILLIDAHPRIGAKKVELQKESPLSVGEQGLDREPDDRAAMAAVDEQLASLNREYEDKFGFRFVVFVNGRPKPVILEVMKQRLRRTRQEELATAVPDLVSIIRKRIENASK